MSRHKPSKAQLCLQAAQMAEAGKGHSRRRRPDADERGCAILLFQQIDFNLKHKPPFPFFLVVLLCFCGERRRRLMRDRLWERHHLPAESPGRVPRPCQALRLPAIFLHSFPRASFEFVLVLSSSRIRSIVYLEVIPTVVGDTAVRQGRGKKPHRACYHSTRWASSIQSCQELCKKQWRVSTCEGRRLGY